ncbi:hypothetical protein [Halorubrum salinum]
MNKPTQIVFGTISVSAVVSVLIVLSYVFG